MWAKSTTGSPSISQFQSITVDNNKNRYAIGVVDGNGTYSFGNGVSINGMDSSWNAVLVKYNSNGDAQWAKSAITAPDYTTFNGIETDSNGNCYIVGRIQGSGSFDFGNGVTVSGGVASKSNTLLIKYNSNGIAQWAKSITSGTNDSYFSSVTLDGSGNIYAAGYISGNGSYDFGNSITVSGTYITGINAVLVKYDSNGTTQWAKSVTAGSLESTFKSIATDNTGKIYTAGHIDGVNNYDFGNNTIINGTYAGGNNVVLVQYDNNGNTMWAKSLISGSDASKFEGITSDYNNNIYTVGSITGANSYNFGNGVTVTGVSSGQNIVLAQYNTTGATQWVKSVSPAPSDSGYTSITSGNNGLYTAGYISGSGSYGLSSGVTVNGAATTFPNTILAKYDYNGNALWAKSTTGSQDRYSIFYSVTLDSDGNPCTVGFIDGNNPFGFGNGVTVSGTDPTRNLVIVNYLDSPISSSSSSSNPPTSKAASIKHRLPVLFTVGTMIVMLF